MPVFHDIDDAKKYLGGIFQLAVSDDELADKLSGANVVLRIHYTDPAWSLTVDMAARTVETEDSSAVPNVEMCMSADDGNTFWLGKLNLATAMARGRVRTKGSMPKVLKLLPIAKSLYPRYQQTLVQDGRQDLLAAGKA